jgi:hypothetical protein
MIDIAISRKYLGTALLSLLLIGILAACSGDTPSAPGGGDGNIDPPPPPPDETGTVTLIWDAPTTDADGSGPITDLVGYTLCYGASPNALDNCSQVGNVTNVQLQLAAGTYYVAVRAVDTWGNQSDFSNVIQVTITLDGAAAGESVVEIGPTPVADADPELQPSR